MIPARVVVSITGPDAAAGAAQAREAEAVGADLLEVRLDLFKTLEDALGILKDRSVPVIATCRREAERGGFRGSEEARRRALSQAVKAGAAWVDLEQDVLSWKPKGAKVIGSFHDAGGVPADAATIVRAMLAGGADVAKLVGTPRSLKEAKGLLDLNALAPGRVAAFGMGPRGIPTRLLAGRAGAWAVYAASDIGPPAAPGQIPLSELLFPFRFREVTAATALYGLLGSPVSQSPGPWAHTAAMRLAGIDGLYLPLDAADAADARFALGGFSLSGASVTRPFKRDLLPVAGELEQEARDVGAINTLARVEGGWLGANTDASGIRRLLSRRGKPRVAVFGAGGLARAAVVAAKGREVAVAARDREAARALARELGVASIDADQLGLFDVVIQTTPAGGVEAAGALPFPPQRLKPGAALIEAHVWPLETPLTRGARKAGVRVVSGLELWLAQAREQFALWHGQEPAPASLARAAVAWVSRLSRAAGNGDPAMWTLALSGMRGSGKTTVGRLAAERLQAGFLDLDEAVAAEAGMPVAGIFKAQGEEAFRRLETRALARQALSPPGVLALGGGTAVRPENAALLAGFAKTVLLEAPVGVLKGRLGLDGGGRPSLTGAGVVEELEGLWASRRAAYRAQASVVVKADADPATVVRRTLDAAGRSG